MKNGSKLGLLPAAGVAWPGAAFAHTGHLTELAGHSHWLALGAGAAALAIAASLAVAGRRKAANPPAVSEDAATEAPSAEAETV